MRGGPGQIRVVIDEFALEHRDAGNLLSKLSTVSNIIFFAGAVERILTIDVEALVAAITRALLVAGPESVEREDQDGTYNVDSVRYICV